MEPVGRAGGDAVRRAARRWARRHRVRTSSAQISRRRNGRVARAARWIAILRRPGPRAAADASCCRAFSLSTVHCCASQRVCAEGGLADAKLSAWRRRLHVVSVRGEHDRPCVASRAPLRTRGSSRASGTSPIHWKRSPQHGGLVYLDYTYYINILEDAYGC